MTLNIYFEDGFQGILNHHDPRKIREWLEIFSNPTVMKDCQIAGVTVDLDNRNPLKEAV